MSGFREHDCETEMRLLALGLCDEKSTLKTLVRNRLYEPRVAGIVKEFMLSYFAFGEADKNTEYRSVDIDQRTGDIYALLLQSYIDDFDLPFDSLVVAVYDKHGRSKRRRVLQMRRRLSNLAYEDAAVRVGETAVYVTCEGRLAVYAHDLKLQPLHHKSPNQMLSFNRNGHVEALSPGPGVDEFVAAVATYNRQGDRFIGVYSNNGEYRRFITSSPHHVLSLCVLQNCLSIATQYCVVFTNFDEKPRRETRPQSGFRCVRAAHGNDVLFVGDLRFEFAVHDQPVSEHMPAQRVYQVRACDACADASTGRLVLARKFPANRIACYLGALGSVDIFEMDAPMDESDVWAGLAVVA